MTALPLQIAIDGPAGSGKGEIATRLAKSLNFLYIYTGAMYRALALACIGAGVSLRDEQKVMEVLARVTIDMMMPEKSSLFAYKVLLNGTDVTETIQSQDAAQGASDVGTMAPVRQWMVSRQKQMADAKPVVMEGRDIAIRVLPQAQLKIYLTASLEERAARRFKEWQKKGVQRTLEETIADTKARDLQDMSRRTDPLQKVPDAWELDTTSMTPDQVVAAIVQELQKRDLV